jgi:hypothetical protein
MGVGFQHHALDALPPGRRGTLCKGPLLNVESVLDGQGQSCFPPEFNPPDRLIPGMSSNCTSRQNFKTFVFGTSVACFFFTFYLMISLGLNLS